MNRRSTPPHRSRTLFETSDTPTSRRVLLIVGTVLLAAGLLMPLFDDDPTDDASVNDATERAERLHETLVEDAMTSRPITVTPTMPVSSALARMAALGVGRLPVVDDLDPNRVVGMFRRNSVVAAYHHALGAVTDRHLYRQRLRQRVQPGATFYEVPVPPASAAAGKRVKDLDWPEEAVLVSIRRDAAVIIPHGDTVLRVNDTITAFGHGDSRVAVAFVLERKLSADGADQDPA